MVYPPVKTKWPFFVNTTLYYGGPYLPGQNILFHGKIYFSKAKYTSPRQNLLSHGKTYFPTAKRTFSRQNILFHGKTFYRFQSLSVCSFQPFEIRDLVIDLIQDGGRGRSRFHVSIACPIQFLVVESQSCFDTDINLITENLIKRVVKDNDLKL